MSVDVNRLQKTISGLDYRAKHVAIVYPIVSGLCFFLLSWMIMANDVRYLDRTLFVFVGVVLGRKLGTLTKAALEERKIVLEGFLELHAAINKPAVLEAATVKVEQKAPESISSTANEAVLKVEIPGDPNLPNIPSAAVPADVKDALKDKSKPTKVVMKKKLKP